MIRHSIITLLVISLALASHGSFAADDDDSHHLPHNHIALIAAAAFEEQADGHRESGNVLGLEYIRQVTAYWGWGAGGLSDSGLSSAVLKAIYFPVEGKKENYGYRVAVGMDWIVDLADEGSALGVGADQIAPFFGVALANSKGTALIPLVQHFISYNGEDISTTAFRIIAMHSPQDPVLLSKRA